MLRHHWGVLLFFVAWGLLGCEDGERQREYSRIQPPELLIPGRDPIHLLAPANGSGVTVLDGHSQALNFEYAAEDSYFGALFLFRERPTTETGSLTDVAESCIGGVTDMDSGHHWSPGVITLSPTPLDSQLYRCVGGNPFEPFSSSEKLTLNEADFEAGNTVYWAVLGYSAYSRLTHASPLYRLNIE